MMVTSGACGRGDTHACAALIRQASLAARAGVDAVQVREPHLDARELLALVAGLVRAVSDTRARVLVNRRVDVAIAAGAHGAHVPFRGLPARRVRELAPPGFLLGRSVHTTEEALDAAAQGGCDYLVFGTVYESASKPAGHELAGIAGLRAACAAVALPVLAIGGVTTDRAADIAAAGAAGVAAISAFGTAGHPDEDAPDTMRRLVEGLRAPFVRRGGR